MVFSVNRAVLPLGFDTDENVTDIPPPLILLQETWFRAFAVLHEFLFGTSVVRTIGLYGVGALELVGHREARRSQTVRLETCRIHHRQPVEMIFALVRLFLAVSELVFVDEGAREAHQPQVIIKTLAQPYAARVFGVGRLVPCSVGRRGEILWRCRSRSPVACVQQLAGFQYHLDNMFVKVVLRAQFGVPVKEEYVHFGGGAGGGF